MGFSEQNPDSITKTGPSNLEQLRDRLAKAVPAVWLNEDQPSPTEPNPPLSKIKPTRWYVDFSVEECDQETQALISLLSRVDIPVRKGSHHEIDPLTRKEIAVSEANCILTLEGYNKIRDLVAISAFKGKEIPIALWGNTIITKDNQVFFDVKDASEMKAVSSGVEADASSREAGIDLENQQKNYKEKGFDLAGIIHLHPSRSLNPIFHGVFSTLDYKQLVEMSFHGEAGKSESQHFVGGVVSDVIDQRAVMIRTMGLYAFNKQKGATTYESRTFSGQLERLKGFFIIADDKETKKGIIGFTHSFDPKDNETIQVAHRDKGQWVADCRLKEKAEAGRWSSGRGPSREPVAVKPPPEKLTVKKEAQSLKETEWQPKVRPFDLVLEYVSKIIKETDSLPDDVAEMLGVWKNSPDRNTRLLVIGILNKYYKGKQEEPLLKLEDELAQRVADRVLSFVVRRIKSGTVTEAELKLLEPWGDCPETVQDQEITYEEFVKSVVTKGKEALMAKEKLNRIEVEYAGLSSRGGRSEKPDEDSIFYPGKLELAEIYDQKTDEEKIERLIEVLEGIGIFRTREEVKNVAKTAEDLIKEKKFGGLYLVADGLGGEISGEISSSIATFISAEFIINSLARDEPIDDDLVKKAIQEANKAVYQFGSGRAMTTMVLALVKNNGEVTFGNIGDSRAYLLEKDGRIGRITKDHSVVENLVESGQITYKETYTHPYKNSITRALGEESVIEVDIFQRKLNQGDLLILACDGVWEGFPPSVDQTKEQVHENLRLAILGKTPAEMVEILTTKTVGEISKDNTSAVVFRVR